MRKVALLVVLGLGLLLGLGPAQAKTIEEVVEIPVRVSGPSGEPISQKIKVTIFRDRAAKRSPFLILNHGRDMHEEERARLGRARFSDNAQYFVAKGYAVFVPTRVGYGVSGGPDAENTGPCRTKAYPPGYAAAADQSIAVIDYAKAQPYVDPGRGIVAGQSFGGTTAIALAARNIPGVLAAVNFAGGGGGNPQARPGNPCRSDLLAELFAGYGAKSSIPTLWVYSENDKHVGKEAPRTWFNAFLAKGGTGTFVQLPPLEPDGHGSFTRNTAAWRPAFEEFLTSCCSKARQSEPKQAGAETALSDTPEAFTQVLRAWATKHKIRRAVVVVRRGGKVVHRAGIGGGNPGAAHHLASLSKAITGACIATLVRDGKLSFATPLSKALARYFKANGKPADARIGRATIAHLLTHRAGFAGAEDGDDAATGTNLQAYLATHPSSEPPQPAYLARVLATKLARDPGQRFVYSNAGYLILGAVIEEATGRPYEEHCRGAVLAPVGATGELEPAWRVMGAYGGWRMTGADYLAFLEQLDPSAAKFGRATQTWMLDPAGKTYGTTSHPLWYGPGLRMRDAGRGVEIWHMGSWRRRATTQGMRAGETSTFAMRLADGASWFVHSTPLVRGGARGELERELRRAYQAVRWR